ncbi:MAG: GAF domain-containing protein [Gemmatimonadales bacterium]|nr:GAF domain-containing protein [Gemmatimonadales bacterium]
MAHGAAGGAAAAGDAGLSAPAAGDARAAEAEAERLRRELRRHGREVEVLRLAGRALAGALDPESLAAALASLAADTLRADRAIVALVEGAEARVRAVQAGGAPRAAWGLRLDLPGSLARRALRDGKATWTNDPAGDALAPFAVPGLPPCRHALAVPVLGHTAEPVGVLEVQDRYDAALFGQHEGRLAESLAAQAAIAADRALLFERMRDWSQSLEMLLAFTATVNRITDPPTLVRELVAQAARFLKADGAMAALALPAGERGETVLVADGYWHEGSWHDFHRQWRPGEGIPGHLLQSEFPWLTAQYAADPLGDPGIAARFGVVRALAVPIRDGEGGILGVFKLHAGAQREPFSWQEAAFLESLAGTTAVAMRNAQLAGEVQLRRAAIEALSARHVRRLEEERRHIARELHDEAGQALVGIKLGLQVLARSPYVAPALGTEIDQLREVVHAATVQLKDLARRLRPPTLDALGLAESIRQLAADFSQRTGVEVRLRLHLDAGRLDAEQEIALYRVVQEALTNIARHAEAGRVWIGLLADARGTRLVIRDNGRGFLPREAGPGGGLGLLGMRERADMLGGHFVLWSAPGAGTRLRVVVPARA